jgi:hypothetical protein
MSALTANIKESQYDSITVRRPRSPTATPIGQEIIGLVQDKRRVYPELVEYLISTRVFEDYFEGGNFIIPSAEWKTETGLKRAMTEVLDANLNSGSVYESQGNVYILPI